MHGLHTVQRGGADWDSTFLRQLQPRQTRQADWPCLTSCMSCRQLRAGALFCFRDWCCFKQLQGKPVATAGSLSHTLRAPQACVDAASVQGSTLLLQALVLEAEERMEGHGETLGREAAFFEVTIASVDQPRLLSRLSEALVRAGVKSGWLCCTAPDVLLGGCGMAQLQERSS